MAILNIQPHNITWYKKDSEGRKSLRRIDNTIHLTPEKAYSILTLETNAGYCDEIIYACYKLLLDTGVLRGCYNHQWKRKLFAQAISLRKRGLI